MTQGSEEQATKLRIGVSACLVGHEVRYNGGHLRDSGLASLTPYVEWVTVCPEVESGMGVPREEVNLIGTAESHRMIGRRSGTDFTDNMKSWGTNRVAALAGENLDGFILTKDSPSCGVFRVRVRQDNNSSPSRNAMGIFARLLTDALPHMPVEEQGRMNDPRLRERFIDHVYVRSRWQHMLDTERSARGLVRFHTNHKMTLMSHNESVYRSMGRVVANAGKNDLSEVLNEYQSLLTRTMQTLATTKRHTNVLQHLTGYLKQALGSEDKQELADLIERYRQGSVPLIVPVTLLHHHFRRNPVNDWVTSQIYLDPYPYELMLRNAS